MDDPKVKVQAEKEAEKDAEKEAEKKDQNTDPDAWQRVPVQFSLPGSGMSTLTQMIQDVGLIKKQDAAPVRVMLPAAGIDDGSISAAIIKNYSSEDVFVLNSDGTMNAVLPGGRRRKRADDSPMPDLVRDTDSD